MYIGPHPYTGGAGLSLTHIDHLTFDGRAPFQELDYPYFRDLWKLFGLSWQDDYLSVGRNTFREMIEVALGRLGPLTENLDVAVLANSTPDAEPGFCMPYLDEEIGGIDTVFAISDQGAASAFTALRLVSRTLPAGRNGRALVVVIDQSTVLPGPAVPEDIAPLRDSLVVAVLDRRGALGAPRIRQHAGMSADDIADLLSAESEGAEAVTAICRPSFAPYWAESGVKADIRLSADGLPCTGLWTALSELHRERGELSTPERPVILADYDPAMGYVSICRLDAGADA